MTSMEWNKEQKFIYENTGLWELGNRKWESGNGKQDVGKLTL